LIPFGDKRALLGLGEGAYSIGTSAISKVTFGSTVALTSAYVGKDGSQWLGRADGSILEVNGTSASVTTRYERLPGPVSSLATSTTGMAFAIVGTPQLSGPVYASTGGAWTMTQTVAVFKLPGARIMMLPGGTEALVLDFLHVWRVSATKAGLTGLDPTVTPVSLLETKGRGVLLLGEIKSLGTHWYTFDAVSSAWTQANPTFGSSASFATPFRNGFSIQSVTNTWYVDDDASLGNQGACPTPLFTRSSMGVYWAGAKLDDRTLLLVGRNKGAFPVPVTPVWVVTD
jgi:hypothetical protein